MKFEFNQPSSVLENYYKMAKLHQIKVQQFYTNLYRYPWTVQVQFKSGTKG